MENKKKILIVDDEEDICITIGLRLRRLGLEVDCAHNGRNALEKAESFKPDLLLLDIVLPEMDGITVCRQLRENPTTQSISIYLMTTSVIDYHDSITASGADGYFEKPFDETIMIEKIKEILKL